MYEKQPLETNHISRRAFLKLGGLAGLSLLLPGNKTPYLQARSELLSRTASASIIYAKTRCAKVGWQPLEISTRSPVYNQARVLGNLIDVYDRPSFTGNKVRVYWQDSVLPILGATVGEDEEAYNPIWYRVGVQEYVYSGNVQPVRTDLQEPNSSIPEGGWLAEVTVPYTDAHWKPGREELVAYRFFYNTTHWVIQLVRGIDGQPWYAILDDKWEYLYYVPARYMRLMPLEELEPLSPHIPAALKRLEVRLPEQLVIAYELDQPVFMTRAATGGRYSDGDFRTKPGRYTTFHKRPSRHMAAGNLALNGYDLPGVPWICYFTENGLSFHGTFWHNDYGRPRSHGCINLTPQAAKWIYRWTTPEVPPEVQMIYKRGTGTPLDVIEEPIQ